MKEKELQMELELRYLQKERWMTILLLCQTGYCCYLALLFQMVIEPELDYRKVLILSAKSN